ncbi:AraC family transcriptional regulator [uncultured Vagococcus sp.]|uniref:AraC family transcriptional regulator n=1 Tax=uncultured Vagococcus sp. TaxID=189676 RepID=UPI0028D392C6|nr:AraC family transcriptional regulator [uncultured Vagococcus sp.]
MAYSSYSAHSYEKIECSGHYPYKIFTFKTNNNDRLIGSHWHENGELIVCFSGVMEVKMANRTYQLAPNDCIFINSSVSHSTQGIVAGDFLVIQFPLAYLKEVTEGDYFEGFQFDFRPRRITEQLKTLFSLIKTHFFRESVYHHLLVKAKILEVLALLCEEWVLPIVSVAEIQSVKYLKKLTEINDYISLHYRSNLLIKQVAKEFGYNPSYFSRLYKKSMGMTFSDYLNGLRLRSAYLQLINTDLTVLEIAVNNGFSSKSLYNAFKKNYGLSPHHYRQRYVNQLK